MPSRNAKICRIQPDIVLVDVEYHERVQDLRMIKPGRGTKHIPVLLLVGSFEAV